jgi:hypothetical protein
MLARRVFRRVSTVLRARPRGLAIALGTVWLAAAAGGLYVLWQYDNTPGEAARAPGHWPSPTTLSRATDRPTVVMLAHPHCTCTRASLGELAEAIARAQVRPKTYVLFMTPETFATGWEQTDLWRTAAALPDATVVRDENGREARHFGAVTSGQTLLYDEHGVLVFSGGVTGARAHAGDNLGRRSLVALLNHQSPARDGTSVFGCPLFTSGS